MRFNDVPIEIRENIASNKTTANTRPTAAKITIEGDNELIF